MTYRKSDFDAVVELIAPAYSEGGDLGYSWPRDEIERYASIYACANGLCFIAEEDGQVVGTALAYVLKTEPGVVHLEFVEPGSGLVSEAVVAALVAKVKERKLKWLRPEDTLTVKVEAFVPIGQRSEAFHTQGFHDSKPWIYCTKPIC